MNKDYLRLTNAMCEKDRKNICKEILNRENITSYEYLYLQEHSGVSISELFDKYPSHGKYVVKVANSKNHSLELKNPHRSPFIDTDTIFRDDLDDKFFIFKQIEWAYKFPNSQVPESFINCKL